MEAHNCISIAVRDNIYSVQLHRILRLRDDILDFVLHFILSNYKFKLVVQIFIYLTIEILLEEITLLFEVRTYHNYSLTIRYQTLTIINERDLQQYEFNSKTLIFISYYRQSI